MTDSWNILQKSIAIIIDNISEALRISGAIFVISVFAATAVTVLMTGGMIAQMPVLEAGTVPTPQEQAEIVQIASAMLISNLIFFVAMSWIAVAWHRYVLLEEETNQLFPYWKTGRILGYLWKTLVVGFCVGFMVVFPFVIAASLLGAVGMAAVLPILGLAMFVCFYYLFFRMGLALPASALDQKMTLKEAFQATTDLSNQIWGLAVLVVGITLIAGILIGTIAPNNIIGVLITSVFQWFMVMISASLLTTLYGHAIERRSL